MWQTSGFDITGGFQKPSDLNAVASSIHYFSELNTSGFYYKWIIRLQGSNEFIGELECYPVKPQIRPWLEWGLGYCLKISAWKNGYMTEALNRILKFAFTESSIVRLIADVNINNHRSIKLLNKIGFQQEGIQKSKNYSNGKFNDMLLMSHTRDRYTFRQ
jgi:ribosomal-protein-alanine N-acetyltransferase